MYLPLPLPHSPLALSLSLSFPRTRLVGAIFNLLLQQFGAVKGNASSAFALSWENYLRTLAKGDGDDWKRGTGRARGLKLPKKWPLAIDTTNNPNRESHSKSSTGKFSLSSAIVLFSCGLLSTWG